MSRPLLMGLDMFKNMNVSTSENQKRSLDDYRFAARVGSRSEVMRDLVRAGLVAVTAGPDSAKAQAAKEALQLWDTPDDPTENQEG